MAFAQRSRLRDALLILLASVLFAGFCSLGTWQLYRREWKLDLIAQVDRQLARQPVSAPARDAWATLDANHAYLPVQVSGTYLHDRETLVQAMTAHGSGYWLLTPLQTAQGFIVLINRGFVDSAHRDPGSRPEAQHVGLAEVKGLLRISEPHGRMLQRNDAEGDWWYSRDVYAIGAARGLNIDDLAPYFIDADRTPNPGGWPVGGLTVVQFRNTHLMYALTWYALALMTAVCAWLAFTRRSE